MSLAESAALSWAVDHARELLENRSITVLTGAGISTDSGIPDYRGGGKSPRNPISYQQFVSSSDVRARYWARSYVGWQRISSALPNAAHNLLADAEGRGRIQALVTQNVDGLHAKAGSQRLTELHGSLERVVCLDCRAESSRNSLTNRIRLLNPQASFSSKFEIAPDGDAAMESPQQFNVPDCLECGGVLKPKVVFFGENIPAPVAQKARSEVSSADSLLVVGSSLAVNSALRLVQLAVAQKTPVIIVNLGETKADAICDVKIEASASASLGELFG